MEPGHGFPGCRDRSRRWHRESGLVPPQPRARRDHCYAPILASQAIEKLLRASGGEGLFEDFEIQQCYRDAYATASHIGTNWDAGSAQFGQIALGGGMPKGFNWI